MVFQPLGSGALRRIVERELRLGLARQGLARRRVRVECDESLVDRLIMSGTDPRYGARPLQRAVRRAVLEPLARWLSAEPDARDRLVSVAMVDGQPTLHQEAARDLEVHVIRAHRTDTEKVETLPLVAATR